MDEGGLSYPFILVRWQPSVRPFSPCTTLFRSNRAPCIRDATHQLGGTVYRPYDRRLPTTPAATNSRPAFEHTDRKSTRLNSSHVKISYAVFCLKKKKKPL